MLFSCDFSMRGTALKPANSKWNETLLQDLFPARTASTSSTCVSPGDRLEIKTRSNNAVCSAASATDVAPFSPKGLRFRSGSPPRWGAATLCLVSAPEGSLTSYTQHGSNVHSSHPSLKKQNNFPALLTQVIPLH